MKKVLILFFPLLVLAEIIKFYNLKSNYYKNQIVTLNGKIILKHPIDIQAIPSYNTKINFTKKNPYIYEFNITFQANLKPHKIIFIGPEFYKELNLNSFIKFKTISPPEKFSNVFAKKFKIINPISSKYNENYNILSFRVKCQNCNIKDFSLKAKEQNLTLISNNEASYYIVLPKNIKKLYFYYFDLNTQTFKKISIPIILKENTISTQTEINPEENIFFTPLNIFILSLIAFFLMVFLIYQKIWILIFPFILGGYLIYTILPKGEILLPKNTKIQILPTPQSTIIYITKKSQNAKILNKINRYTKVKIENKIGWVKNENIK